MKRVLKSEEVIYDFNSDNNREDKDGEFVLPQYEEVYRRINTALSMRSDGYNIYLVDEFCKSRINHIISYVKYILKDAEAPKDICYVIKEDDKVPIAIFVNNGYGNYLKEAVENLKEEYAEGAYKFYNNLDNKEKEELVATIKNRRSEIIEDLINQSKELGFDIRIGGEGFTFVPIVDGKEMTEEQFDELEEEERSDIMDKVADLKVSAHEILDKLRNMKYDELNRIKEIMKNFLQEQIAPFYEAVEEDIGDDEEALGYIKYIMEEVEEALIDNYSINYEDDEEEIKAIISKYEVNVIVDNSKVQSPPVIFEEDPSTSNLLGSIEYENHNNVYVSTVKSIKAGSYVKANGGCIIIKASSLFTHSQAYYYLKKSLLSEKVDLDYNRGYIELFTLGGLKPVPMKINTKVIIIGDFEIYDALYNYDSEFKTIFKLRAEYKGVLEAKQTVKNLLINEVQQFIDENKLKPVTKSGLREISKYLSRKAEDRYKFLFDHSEISNILLLADSRANEENRKSIDGDIVEAVGHNKELLEEEYDNLYKEGKVLIKVTGEEVGQINALSVIDIGYISFGKPMRITCTCSLGDGRIVDTQRESNMSGKIHTKAISILKGYMSNLNGGYTRLPVDFNLSFEQVYGMVDGDSASVAEALVMVSALCKLPIKQNIALTGSINQFGVVQPIGGVNEKIEGFFNICKAIDTVKGKGIIIPASNARNLILCNEVESAIAKGDFTIYTMETVEDAMEIVFGKRKVTRESLAKLIAQAEKKYKTGDKPKKTVAKKKAAPKTEDNTVVKEAEKEEEKKPAKKIERKPEDKKEPEKKIPEKKEPEKKEPEKKEPGKDTEKKPRKPRKSQFQSLM